MQRRNTRHQIFKKNKLFSSSNVEAAQQLTDYGFIESQGLKEALLY
jgi:hypothetical protein